MFDHHVGRVPFLSTGQANRGRRTANLEAQFQTQKPVVLQFERRQQTETGPKVAGATDAIPEPAQSQDQLSCRLRIRQQISKHLILYLPVLIVATTIFIKFFPCHATVVATAPNLGAHH